mmetsp:Transcript_26337/g.84341  ORF Transcript_26337/g.84341 Transcript_26337/m.84341 type:complete len:703 (+) Transcript_26337:1098-3206(+)
MVGVVVVEGRADVADHVGVVLVHGIGELDQRGGEALREGNDGLERGLLVDVLGAELHVGPKDGGAHGHEDHNLGHVVVLEAGLEEHTRERVEDHSEEAEAVEVEVALAAVRLREGLGGEDEHEEHDGERALGEAVVAEEHSDGGHDHLAHEEGHLPIVIVEVVARVHEPVAGEELLVGEDGLLRAGLEDVVEPHGHADHKNGNAENGARDVAPVLALPAGDVRPGEQEVAGAIGELLADEGLEGLDAEGGVGLDEEGHEEADKHIARVGELLLGDGELPHGALPAKGLAVPGEEGGGMEGVEVVEANADHGHEGVKEELESELGTLGEGADALGLDEVDVEEREVGNGVEGREGRGPADREEAHELVELEEGEGNVEREVLLHGARVKKHPEESHDEDQHEGHDPVLGVGVTALEAVAAEGEVVVGAGHAEAALVLGIAHEVLVAPFGAVVALDEHARLLAASGLLPPPASGVKGVLVLARLEAALADAAGLLAGLARGAVDKAVGLPEAAAAKALGEGDTGGADGALGVGGALLALGLRFEVAVEGGAEDVALQALGGVDDGAVGVSLGGLGGVVALLARLAGALLRAAEAGGAGAAAIGDISAGLDLLEADGALGLVNRGKEARGGDGLLADLDVPEGHPPPRGGEGDFLHDGTVTHLGRGGGGEGPGGAARGSDEGGAEANCIPADVEVGVGHEGRGIG